MVSVIIAGSRDFTDYTLAKEKLDKIFRLFYLNNEDVSIVSGGARGADYLGECYAKERGLKLKIFPADWDKYGKSAGYRRNSEMAQYATHLVAFWDGKSKGTHNMIDLANKNNLKVRIVRV
jgi:hypothetical protein